MKNIKQKYFDINKENNEIKNKIIILQNQLGINQKKELKLKNYMHNIYTLTSKKPKKSKNLKSFLTEKKENLEINSNNNSNNEEIAESFNFQNDNNKEENVFFYFLLDFAFYYLLNLINYRIFYHHQFLVIP